MLQLNKFTEVDCDLKPEDSAKILFQQAYAPYLILGATPKVYPMFRKVGDDTSVDQADTTIIQENQKYDILLEFRCPDIWLVRASK